MAVPWHNYPHLWATPTFKPLLVIFCKVSDNSAEPPGLMLNVQRFLTVGGSGQGNMTDYYADTSYGAISLAGSKVIGWYTAPFSTADLNGQLSGPGNRWKRVQACANVVPDADIDFGSYASIIMIPNIINDDGACWGDGPHDMTIHNQTYHVGCVVLDGNGLYTSLAAHEVGHSFGLVHSYDNSSCEYCDQFDLMSAFNNYRFTGANFAPFKGSDGPGLGVPNLLQMGWIPPGRITTYHIGDAETTSTLTALSHPAGNHPLTVEIVGSDPNNITTVEYRQTDGWDAGLPDNTVLIHQYRKGQVPWSFLIRSNATYSGEWLPGMNYSDLAGFGVTVVSIDAGSATATVKIGLPTLFTPKPSIQIVSPANGSSFAVGQSFSLVATATSFTNQILPDAEVTWQANGQPIGTGKILTTSFASPGVYTISATATDHGQSASQSITVFVVKQPTATPLSKPTVQILSPTQAQNFQFTDPGSFTMTLASSASSGVVSYQWSDSVGLISDTKANDTVTLTPTSQQVPCGTTNDTVKLKVTDKHNQSASTSVTITIQRVCIG
jgi:M6 family metalloprotease-like protein